MVLQQYVDRPTMNEELIQGDILIGLQKRAEIFAFFEITDSSYFATNSSASLKGVTSLKTTRIYETNVTGPKKDPMGQPLDKMNIAFSYDGLTKIGVITTDDGLEEPFIRGQRASASALGDDLSNWQSAYDADVPIDGVMLFASFSTLGAVQALDAAKQHLSDTLLALGDSVKLLHREIGMVRSGTDGNGVAQAGHEHFGFADGVSQPGIHGLSMPLSKDKSRADKGFPGQDLVALGEFVFGHSYATEEGTDSAPVMATPPQEWMANGSYMVFRRLNQNVDAFNAYAEENWPGFASGPDQFAARVIGRWPDGSPLVRNPATPNKREGGDEVFTNNDFDFGPNDVNHVATDFDQKRCPFASHIRRMYMRSDAADDRSEKHRIIRAGIAFGEDREIDKGLLFVCYQRSIKNQFEFIQEAREQSVAELFVRALSRERDERAIKDWRGSCPS